MPAPDGPTSPPYRPAPEFQQVLDDLNRIGNPLDNLTPESAKQLWLAREILARNVLAPIAVEGVRDLVVPARNHSIPIRIYSPAGHQARANRPPILLYLHGGGWALGSIASYDSLTRALANKTGAMVISADYRLAPEHPFPAALEDAHLVLEWIARNATVIGGDEQRLAVAGDSAGANLATIVALRARKEGIPVVFQALFYPSTHIAQTDTTSYKQYGHGHWLTTRSIQAFREFYLPNKLQWESPEVSPLLTPDSDLALMPPALVMTCGCDPLRDEGEAYANKLRRDGVKVTYRLEEQMIHACLGLYNSRLYPAASARVEGVLDELSQIIRAELAARP